MGNPMAKSLLIVQKMVKIPAFPISAGLVIISVITITKTAIIILATKTESTKFQFTESHLISSSDKKMVDGRAKVPT